MVVYAYAKILILKQITTHGINYHFLECCICLCKDTNFKANHNLSFFHLYTRNCCICLCKDTNFKANHNQEEVINGNYGVVYAYAKILILKQITTGRSYLNVTDSCICLCKDTNFKANHNPYHVLHYTEQVVYAYAKILILKQITTYYQRLCSEVRLYMPMQRY